MNSNTPKPATPPPATPADEAPETPPADDQKNDGQPGATPSKVGDRTGPGAGFDQEPRQDKDTGGVAPS